jgi:hypothetical protein
MAILHLALLALLAASSARAEESAADSLLAAETPPARGAEVRFVPPGSSGTVSLGIYDASGRLVRVLADEWTFNRFRIGLNGLSTAWDGLDNQGRPVPAGTYAARGFIVGDVQVAGEAFHFNDWIESADSPRIVAVAAQQLLPGGDILLAARLAGARGAMIRYSPESEARWRTMNTEPRPEAAKGAQLAVSDTMAFLLLDGQLRAAGLEDGSEMAFPVEKDGVMAMAARGDRLAVLVPGAVRFYRLPAFASQGEAADLPVALTSIALLDQGAVACGEDGSVWRWQAGWSRLEMPEGVKVRGVSSGPRDTFWIVEERADGSSGVAQYSPEEGRLAEWLPRPEDGKLLSVTGTTEKDFFLALLAGEDTRRSVGIRRKEAGGWEFVFDKKITRCADFGWTDGVLSASSNGLPEELTAEVAENPLDPEAPRNLTLRAVADTSGTGLATTDGLPLLRISGEAGYGRVMMVEGNAPGTARFFQGDGACVEEYAVTNLADITAFDAGMIEMAGEQEAAAPAEVDGEAEE